MSKTSYLRRPLAALLMAALAASVVMAAVVVASPAWAATYTVTNTNDAGAGSLRRAIIDANATTGVADTINFDLGSAATIFLTSAQLPTIADGAGLTIDGGSANIEINGGNMYRVFDVGSGAKLSLSNLTVVHGAPAPPDGSGGAIYNGGGTVTVSNSTLSNNYPAGSGGAIYNDSGTVTVSNSTLSNNSAFGSEDGSGGAIYNDSGTVTVSNSTLSSNSAGSHFCCTGGGGIYNAGTATVSNSTLSSNIADHFGGGIANGRGGPLEVNNSTLSGNSVRDEFAFGGGGIYNESGTATFKNTIVANSPSASGGSCYGEFGSANITDGGYNLDSDNTCGFSTNNNSLSGVDPMLGALADNGGPTMTHALLEGSPAIDKAVAVEGITTDQRGVARPQGAAPDIGSFEFVNTMKPMVRNTNPANGATLIAPGVNVTATFSEAMDARTTDGDPSTINAKTFKLVRLNSDGTTTRVTAAVSYAAATKKAILNPASNLGLRRTYKATVTSGAQDLAGNALDQKPNIAGNQAKSWRFKVQ